MYKSAYLSLILPCLLVACGGSSGTAQPTVDVNDPTITARADIRDTDQLYAYRADSPYASNLKACALASTYESSCTLETLPFITQATPNFDREDILDRLLVTHDWMGRRFEALLAAAPESMIPLFGSVTAISIGSTVRPSYYWSLNGAIRFDPADMWLSNAEKANISIASDYRSEFGAGLQFWSFGSLRKGNNPAHEFYNLTDTQERTLEDIKIPSYALWYHELAHAFDFLPNESVPTLNSRLKVSDALWENSSLFLSPQLDAQSPLLSDVLWTLGDVSFRGNEATAQQNSFTPTFVGSEMANDGAMQYYSYSTIREDFATLFEKLMMKREFDVDYFVAFVQKPADTDNYYCSELLVGWGVKNRLADPVVMSRARWVLESIYGVQPELEQFFAVTIGEQTPMATGVDWCTNRDGVLPSASGVQARSVSRFDPVEFERLEAERQQLRH